MRLTQRIVVVGGGVLGTMHAVAARRRGYQVVHLEREGEARGASVRNFGLVWVSGRRAGAELALALRARELWGELGAAVPGLHFRAAGSLTLATGEAELSVLKEAAALPDAGLRGFELLDPAPSQPPTRRCAASWPAACCAAPTRSSSRAWPCPRCAPTWPGPAMSGGPASR